MKMKVLMVVSAVMFALIAGPAQAREGLYLGAYYQTTTLSGDVLSTVPGVDSGTGLGGRLGLGIGRYLGIEGTLFKTTHDAGLYPTIDYKGGTIDFKIYFPLTGSGLEPYLMAGVGKYKLENVFYNPGVTYSYSGEGAEYGIGVNLYLFPELSLNAGYTKQNITFDSGTPLGVDLDGKARTFDVGITYHFL